MKSWKESKMKQGKRKYTREIHKFIIWLTISEVELHWTSSEWAIDVENIGYSWKTLGPDQPHADLACACHVQFPTLLDPVDCGLPDFLCQRVVVSKQEYWRVLSNTGCRTLLEHYSSFCPTANSVRVTGAARIPETQAVAPPLHLAIMGQTQVLKVSLRNKP